MPLDHVLAGLLVMLSAGVVALLSLALAENKNRLSKIVTIATYVLSVAVFVGSFWYLIQNGYVVVGPRSEWFWHWRLR